MSGRCAERASDQHACVTSVTRSLSFETRCPPSNAAASALASLGASMEAHRAPQLCRLCGFVGAQITASRTRSHLRTGSLAPQTLLDRLTPTTPKSSISAMLLGPPPPPVHFPSARPFLLRVLPQLLNTNGALSASCLFSSPQSQYQYELHPQRHRPRYGQPHAVDPILLTTFLILAFLVIVTALLVIVTARHYIRRRHV
ncbi:hypothetical protein DFH09DRAFT_1312709 [Mycena vulgaris]|nr:hypothetical protein DFH09DRAFT_1312709 [Mycena vulgaris]